MAARPAKRLGGMSALMLLGLSACSSSSGSGSPSSPTPTPLPGTHIMVPGIDDSMITASNLYLLQPTDAEMATVRVSKARAAQLARDQASRGPDWAIRAEVLADARSLRPGTTLGPLSDPGTLLWVVYLSPSHDLGGPCGGPEEINLVYVDAVTGAPAGIAEHGKCDGPQP